MPTSAARNLDAGARGIVMRCQLTSVGPSQATTVSALGSSAAVVRPWRATLRPSALSR